MPWNNFAFFIHRSITKNLTISIIKTQKMKSKYLFVAMIKDGEQNSILLLCSSLRTRTFSYLFVKEIRTSHFLSVDINTHNIPRCACPHPPLKFRANRIFQHVSLIAGIWCNRTDAHNKFIDNSEKRLSVPVTPAHFRRRRRRRNGISIPLGRPGLRQIEVASCNPAFARRCQSTSPRPIMNYTGGKERTEQRRIDRCGCL